jgi:ATP-binding cassette subfamily F protein uup
MEYDKLSSEIPQLEKERVELEQLVASGISDHVALMKATERLGIVIGELDEKGFRWLELSEYV